MITVAPALLALMCTADAWGGGPQLLSGSLRHMQPLTQSQRPCGSERCKLSTLESRPPHTPSALFLSRSVCASSSAIFQQTRLFLSEGLSVQWVTEWNFSLYVKLDYTSSLPAMQTNLQPASEHS